MDSPLLMDIIVILLCIVISAFFSGAETALTAVSRARIFHLVQAGNKIAALVKRLRDKKDSLIGTILLGNTLVNIASASIGTVLFVRLFGDELGPVIATIVMTILILIFSEVLPKTIAIHHAESVALAIARPMALVIRLLSPITILVQWVVWAILRLFGVRESVQLSTDDALDAIRGAIDMHHSEGAVVKEDRDRLGGILDLAEREVREIMIHRKKVFSIDFGLEPEAMITEALNSPHSRIPLWQNESDNIIGIIHVRDLMKLVRQQKIGITREMIRQVAHRPWFIPETTGLGEQLQAFRTRRKHFACVVDEYGAWLGIVTLEDIIEEIVGEIEDEHDPFSIADVIPFGEYAFRVAGTVTIRDINRQLDWALPDDHATTVAGLILHEARCIPDKGAVFEFHGYRFIVQGKRANQLTELVVEKLEDATGEHGE
jgi:Mg2+/Co2+ transporter CorB